MWPLTAITRGAGSSARSLRVVASPSSTGIDMSMRTTSTGVDFAVCIASRPGSPSPTTSKRPSPSSSARSPSEKSRWSSTISTRTRPLLTSPARAGHYRQRRRQTVATTRGASLRACFADSSLLLLALVALAGCGSSEEAASPPAVAAQRQPHGHDARRRDGLDRRLSRHARLRQCLVIVVNHL